MTNSKFYAMKYIAVLIFSFCSILSCLSQQTRARDLGIPFEGEPGELNSITDVPGVEVGHSTIINGEGKNIIGEGPVRTGVTAIFPRGKKFSPVYANWYSLNGNGEMTGTTWITESGFLETPIMITNTNSVGVVRDAVLKWYVDTNWYKDNHWYTYPVVAETYDGVLNDIYGFHVKEENVLEAINKASVGMVEEGNVGGGTGMMCLGFKGGIGTASRKVFIGESEYSLGVLVQANFGAKSNLHIAGVPVGEELKDTLNFEYKGPPDFSRKEGEGSIIVIVATDAPLLPHQLKRIAQRVPLGISLVGGRGFNGSGDIFLAFSTANENAFNRKMNEEIETMPNDQLDVLFEATVQAVEESIINAMVAAETMSGINGNKVYALPHEEVTRLMKEYKRYSEGSESEDYPEYFKSLVGKYQTQHQVFFNIRLNNGKLMVIPPNQPQMKLTEQSRDVFQAQDAPLKFTFVRDETDNVIRFNCEVNGQIFTAEKIK